MSAILAGIDWSKLVSYVAPLISYVVAYFVHRAPKKP